MAWSLDNDTSLASNRNANAICKNVSFVMNKCAEYSKLQALLEPVQTERSTAIVSNINHTAYSLVLHCIERVEHDLSSELTGFWRLAYAEVTLWPGP